MKIPRTIYTQLFQWVVFIVGILLLLISLAINRKRQIEREELKYLRTFFENETSCVGNNRRKPISYEPLTFYITLPKDYKKP